TLTLSWAPSTSTTRASSSTGNGEVGRRRARGPSRIPIPIPRKLAIRTKLLKKPMYLTLAGIQRIRSSSTKSRTALVRSSRTAGRARNGTDGSWLRGLRTAARIWRRVRRLARRLLPGDQAWPGNPGTVRRKAPVEPLADRLLHETVRELGGDQGERQRGDASDQVGKRPAPEVERIGSPPDRRDRHQRLDRTDQEEDRPDDRHRLRQDDRPDDDQRDPEQAGDARQRAVGQGDGAAGQDGPAVGERRVVDGSDSEEVQRAAADREDHGDRQEPASRDEQHHQRPHEIELLFDRQRPGMTEEPGRDADDVGPVRHIEQRAHDARQPRHLADTEDREQGHRGNQDEE